MKNLLSLDRIPEMLGRIYASVSGWKPEGQHIELKVMEGEHGFYGISVSGKIVRIENKHASECRSIDAGLPLLVQLDKTWVYDGRSTSKSNWVLVIPLSWGQGPYRLPIASGQAHVFPATEAGADHNLKWQDIIAVCEIRLGSYKQ